MKKINLLGIFLFALIFSTFVSAGILDDLFFSPSNRQMQISVKDNFGAMLPGVTVKFKQGSVVSIIKTTDANGYTPYADLIVGQTYTVEMSKDGYQSTTRTLGPIIAGDPAHNGPYVLTSLTPIIATQFVTVLVKNSQGSGIPGAYVILTSSDGSNLARNTDSTGHATFTVLEGTVNYEVSGATGYSGKSGNILVSSNTNNINIVLTSTGSSSGSSTTNPPSNGTIQNGCTDYDSSSLSPTSSDSSLNVLSYVLWGNVRYDDRCDSNNNKRVIEQYCTSTTSWSELSVTCSGEMVCANGKCGYTSSNASSGPSSNSLTTPCENGMTTVCESSSSFNYCDSGVWTVYNCAERFSDRPFCRETRDASGSFLGSECSSVVNRLEKVINSFPSNIYLPSL